MGTEADASVYDELHALAHSNVPVRRSFYYPLFRCVVNEIQRRKLTNILEVGCGTGGLAELIMARTSAHYVGFDFSVVAIQNAARRTRRPDAFFLGNALNADSYGAPYDGIVCTEVLEHIEADLDVIRMWTPGTQCICSVPNFDYPTHVRHFRSEGEVRARYGQLIEIESVLRVPKPVLVGNTMPEYFRRLRWSRAQPRKMLGLLGINTFEWYAGWFVFCGRRKR